jgi:hypothetical protein
VIRLLQIFAHYKAKNREGITSTKAMMNSSAYLDYIERREHAAPTHDLLTSSEALNAQ